MKIVFTYLLLLLLLPFLAFSQEKISDQLQDPVIELESKLQYHFNSYENNPREGITKLGGGWVKQRHKIEENYSYDVLKTNSLVSPFKGIFNFVIIRSFTKFHKTKEAAESDNDFSESVKTTHQHTYLYQKGEWAVSERINKSEYTSWYDCNEVITEGENKNSTNIHGCWEINF